MSANLAVRDLYVCTGDKISFINLKRSAKYANGLSRTELIKKINVPDTIIGIYDA